MGGSVEHPVTVVVNPAAGRGRMRRLLPQLRAALSRSGLDHHVVVSAHPDHPPELAAAALAAGRAVVACGGDGLVGQVAGVVAERAAAVEAAPMAIVPAGSGNDFARGLGYDPKRPLAALDVLRAGTAVRVDLGRVGDRWFCGVASVGFDAEANRWANERRRLSGTPLYVVAALRTLIRHRPGRFRLVIDGDPHEVEAWMVAVANNPSYGGGMRVAPAARLDDGRLHVTVVGAVGRGTFLRTFPRVFSGRHVEHPAVEVRSGREVRVEAAATGPGADQSVFADGEPAGVLPVTVTAVRAALPVLVPGDSPLAAGTPDG